MSSEARPGTPLIEFRDVTKAFTTAGRGRSPPSTVSISTIERGDIFGDHRLLRCGQEHPGAVDQRVGARHVRPRHRGRRRHDRAERERRLRGGPPGIGMIFQQFNLFRSRTVFGNVAYPLEDRGLAEGERERTGGRAARLRRPHRQGVALPRPAVGRAEAACGHRAGPRHQPGASCWPTSRPARSTRRRRPDVLRLLKRVNAELGVTIVVITHEMEVVRSIADRVAVLDAGRIDRDGRVSSTCSPTRSTRSRAGSSERCCGNSPDATDVDASARAHRGGSCRRASTTTARLGAVLSDAVGTHGVRFEIVYGGINELPGQSFGSLTLELIGDDAGVDALIADLRAVTEVEEVARMTPTGRRSGPSISQSIGQTLWMVSATLVVGRGLGPGARHPAVHHAPWRACWPTARSTRC